MAYAVTLATYDYALQNKLNKLHSHAVSDSPYS